MPKRALTIEDLLKVERLSGISVSPDGKYALIAYKQIVLEKNETHAKSSMIEIDTGKTEAFEIEGKGVTDAVWSADGRFLFFVCDKQIWRTRGDGRDPKCLTKEKMGAQKPVPAPDGSRVLYTTSVYVDEKLKNLQKNSEGNLSLSQLYGLVNPHTKARIIDNDGQFFRHWDSWTDKQYSHLFVLDAETGEKTDLTLGEQNCPPVALGASIDYCFSPNGDEIAYALNPDKIQQRSTNNSIYRQKLNGIQPVGEPQGISITQACDSHPRYLDEEHIAYLGMEEPSYEADYNRIRVFNITTGETQTFLDQFERSPESFERIDENKLLFLAQDFAHVSLFTLDLKTGGVERLTCGTSYTSIATASGRILANQQKLEMPSECVLLENLTPLSLQLTNGVLEKKSQESVRYLTHFSASLSDIELNPGAPLWFEAKDGEKLEGYVVLPPHFDAHKKYPLILLIHGGPQGAFLDSFHYRWNVEMFAAQGAVVAFCNPRGSTGYGRKITREISNDWSGKCPSDILCFLDALLEAYPCIDSERIGAAGASFGGYMINWLAGHSDRFKALVSHDGIFNTEMSGYTTDEFWFSEKEFGGIPYLRQEEMRRHSPHIAVENMNTPMLIIQGEQDFRCFIGEGLALFSALLYRGVESRFLYFPDECHWVLQPANAQQWYHEVLTWLYRFITQ